VLPGVANRGVERERLRRRGDRLSRRPARAGDEDRSDEQTIQVD
jgi:hypothetical protein